MVFLKNDNGSAPGYSMSEAMALMYVSMGSWFSYIDRVASANPSSHSLGLRTRSTCIHLCPAL